MTNQKLFDRYQIQSKIAEGGMATVYLAHDPRFGRDVALKVLSVAYKDQPTFRERFEREARTVAKLEHPAIVPVYDFGEDHDQLFLVMRYMSGGSLAERIVLDPFKPETAVPIIRRIASALDHAHAHGVIHRDLKPANILFDQYDNAFLSDFGIVKLAAEETTTGLTGSGVIGTPAYMSPEQIHGDVAIDGRSDIYTLGIILFEMLTGFKPYRADTPVKQMMAHVLQPVPSIRKYNPLLPPEFEELIRKALAKERGERFKTAEDLHQAFTMTATGRMAAPLQNVPLPQASNLVGVDDDPTTTIHPDPPTIVSTTKNETVVTERDDDSPTIVKQLDKRGFSWGYVVGSAILLLLLGLGVPRLLPLLNDSEADNTPEALSEATVVDEATSAALPPTPSVSPEPTETVTAVSPTQTSGPSEFILGESASGETISGVQVGNGSQVVLLIGGIHAGWSPASVEVAEAVAAHLEANPEVVPDAVTVIVIPNLNPDSSGGAVGELNGRLNGNGIDLNRNWDCNWRSDPMWRNVPISGIGGTTPFSEPEVIALRDLIFAQDVQAVVFWQARVTGGLVSPGGCNQETKVSQQLANIFANAAGYPVADFEALAGQAVNGDSTNWLDAQGIPAVSVLLSTYDIAEPDVNLAGVLAVLAQFEE